MADDAVWSPSQRPEIPDRIDDIVAYAEDQTLLVAEAHQHDPEVQSFKARLERMGYDITKDVTNMDRIRSARDTTEVEDTTTESSSEVRDLRDLFRRAMQHNASDIHIRIHERDEKGEVWFRVHGEMSKDADWNVDYANKLCHTLYNTMTDVADPSFNPLERQDARIVSRDYLPPTIFGIRVATTPIEGGYVMVLRLLYEELDESKKLSDLGYSDKQVDLIQQMEDTPTGLKIIAGPTGGGKSTTLKVCLGNINEKHNERLNILTVEEPPEYPIEGALQTPVTNVENFSDRDQAFNKAIAGTMRVDPDVIMIGEIRDEATASLALRGSMTGHSVWTTLHANSAIDVLDRLLDLEVREEYLANPTVLTATIYQQLIRVICPECREEISIAEAQSAETALEYTESMGRTLDGPLYRRGPGCSNCDDTGIVGRSVVAEIFKPDLQAFEYIQNQQREKLWTYWINELGGATLLQQVVDKVEEGIADPYLVHETLGPMLYRQARWGDQS